jgi:P-type Cu+ transporter
VQTAYQETTRCFHCGEDCISGVIKHLDKSFCCEGCKTVYNLLNETGLCSYYEMNDNPGSSQRLKVREEKFAFLDQEDISRRLIRFKDETQVHVVFYLPQIHCSSCLWLLEHLHNLEPEVISSKVNFPAKEVSIIYNPGGTSLRKMAELLTSIGYEPYFSLHDMAQSKPDYNRSLIYKLGVAGFCFANIMLLSFADYLGLSSTEAFLQGWFRYLSLALSLPVLFYSSQPFFQSAAKGLAHKHLNIDAPIALAILVTFARGVYEVVTASGSGYFDSMSGIVFFMLIGRLLQDRTYRHLSFERDYTSYFPIAVTVIKDDKEITTALPDIKAGDTMLIHNEELIPADGILTMGRALIDYSFVTGESLPVMKEVGELIYAGGKQTGMQMEVLVIKEVSQSYLTSLWNKQDAVEPAAVGSESFVQNYSRYFTFAVLAIALATACYWQWYDPSRTWNAVTAILIVACPCALLLANTFTNGNVLRILSRNNFFLRNATTIENIAEVGHIVFDKTGTLTSARQQHLSFVGKPLDIKTEEAVAALAAQSRHPLCRAISAHYASLPRPLVEAFIEQPGKGIQGIVNGELISLGSAAFTSTGEKEEKTTMIYLAIDQKPAGYFECRSQYRAGLLHILTLLQRRFRLSILSGDNSSEREKLVSQLGKHVDLYFHQKPVDKKNHIKSMQLRGETVMMIGDGLNDAGALAQSDVGVAVAEDANNFTPASDAIIKAESLHLLPSFIRLCRLNKKVILTAFIFSLVYNLAGLSFAVQGTLSPVIAAILMPASSISILLLTFGGSNLIARRLRL